MFESLKIYKGERITQEALVSRLVSFGYQIQNRINEETDVSVRGEILEVHPLNFENPVRIEFFEDVIENISSFEVTSGKAFESYTALIILPIGAITPRSIKQRYSLENPLSNFVDIEGGNYVVHNDHGIGIYKGISRLKSEGVFKDFFVIEYQNRDLLYVPIDDIGLIQKYVSFDRKKPKCNKLGTKTWVKLKEKTKNAIKIFAKDLLDVQASRMLHGGISFQKDSKWQNELERDFPYQLTGDQNKTITEIKTDMELSKPMDRLVCGDVGYGKTELALRAAFKAVMSDKQVALLAPTTVLADQHYVTFRNRLSKFAVNVEMLSRFKTKSEQKEIVKNIAAGKVDITIGTHRMLGNDIKFKDLGLVIIDEEQKFGVRDKEKLKRLRFNVDILTLTATPIPRTLYLSLMGVKDISALTTPPPGRLAIETHITTYDEIVLKNAIERELERKGQVFVINNRIAGIRNLADSLKKIAPEATIEVAHARIPDKTLEKIMFAFVDRKIDILVATNIVQSGLDIPNANTIIINNADQFGLADLYQLRGRVGRLNKQSYAYLVVRKHAMLTDEAKKRIESIKKFSDLGSAFKLAMEDLEIRGAGNILGIQQHGYIYAVGFDLYCRLLKLNIEEIKKQEQS